MGSVWRKTDSGWEKIRSIWRKTDTGWEQIKTIWRKTLTSWEKVFSGTQIPSPTVLPKVRNADGNNIDNVTYIARVGDTLTGYRGEWNDDPTSYERRWAYSSTSGGPYILYSPSETGLTYTTDLTDDDYYVVVEVRATNTAGTSEWYTSNNEAHVIKYTPVSLAKPTFNTTAAEVGITITAQGTGNTYWQRTTNITDDTSPNSYSYLWTYYPGGGTPGASNTSSTYTPVTADVGKRLQVTITATNSGGSSARTSDPTEIVGQDPVADVNPTITRINYPGTSTSKITQGYVLRGNTGQWTPDLTNVFWGFQIGDGTTSQGVIENGTDSSENQNHDLVVPTTYESVNTVGKYIRFYTIPEVDGAQGDTFNTGWIGPILKNPGTPSNLNISYYAPYSSTEVYVTATWTDPSVYQIYRVEYYNPTTATWVGLYEKITSGSFFDISEAFLAPVGTFNYRVRNDNGDGIYAYSNEISKTLSAPYQFNFGNKLYPNTNGWIGIDSGYSQQGVHTTGRGFAVFPGDFVYDDMRQWSGGGGTSTADNVKYVLRYNGYRYNQTANDSNRITWMATFYTNQPYADFKIIYKGSNVSGAVTVGYYENGTLVSGLPGPYTLATGTTFRVNYSGVGANSFGISYDEILHTSPNDIMLNLSTPTVGSLDDGYWDITTASQKFNVPSVTFGTSSNTSNGLSIPFTETNGCDSIDYTVRTGSYSGTIVSGPTNDTSSPINVTGLTANTTYYITATPKNYKGQTGTAVNFTSLTAPAAPTISFSSVTTSSFTATWSATGATSYYVDIYNTSSLVSLFGYPKTDTTDTSASPFGLSAGTQYTVLVAAKNSGGTGTSNSATQRTLFAGLTPTFGTNTRTSGGFNGSVTNYDGTNYTWGISTNSGSVSWGTASGSTRPFSVTGLTAGSSATVTVTTSRSGYANGSNTTSGTALSNLVTNPAYGTATSASGGFSATISTQPNPTGGSYSVVSQTNGTATVNSTSGALSVTGLTAGQSSTVTVRYSLSGYNSIDITSTGSATSISVPGVPRSLTVDNITFSSARINWVAPLSDGGSAITRYEVNRDGANFFSVGNVLSYTYTLSAGTYTIGVRAVNAAGAGNAAYINVTIPTFTTPTSPAPGLQFQRNTTSQFLRWYCDYPTPSGSYSSIEGMQWQISTTASTTGLLNSGTRAYPGAGVYPYNVGGVGWAFKAGVDGQVSDITYSSSARYGRARVVLNGANGNTYYGTWSSWI